MLVRMALEDMVFLIFIESDKDQLKSEHSKRASEVDSPILPLSLI
jgi:hypothetical protein